MLHQFHANTSLAGRKILVTRAAHQAAPLTQKLEAAGAQVIELPLIEILPPESWEAFDNAFAAGAGADASSGGAENYNWLLFAGANAVEFTTARLKETGRLPTIQAQKQLAVAVVGESTAQAAQDAGFTVAFHPAQFTGSSLVKEFPGYPKLSHVKMIWPRTDIGPKDVADDLRKAGAHIDTVISYRTALPKNKNEVAKKLATILLENTAAVITLNSAQTARNFFELLKLGLDSLQDGPNIFQALLASITIASIGPETSTAAKQLLGRVDIEAKTHSTDGLVNELMCCLGSSAQARI